MEDNVKLEMFGAPWCAPCSGLKTTMKAVMADHPEIEFEYVDVMEQAERGSKEGIKGLPTLKMNGKTHVGAMTEAQLRAWIEAAKQ
jgi:thiol-disulfide isomerase/thioredoxin